MRLFTLIVMVFVLSTSVGCGEKSKKPYANIYVENANKLELGEPLRADINIKKRGGTIELVKVYLNSELIRETKEERFIVNVDKLTKLGANIISVDIIKTDGKENNIRRYLTVLSNVSPKKLEYTVKRELEHKREFYTQGLEYHDGKILESTGEHGESGIFLLDKNAKSIMKEVRLNDKYFGEGVSVLNNKIYQLTWQSKKGFVYNAEDFSLVDSFALPSDEGWGITNDGEHLIISDGTCHIFFLSPNDFKVAKIISIYNDKGKVEYLNELELVGDFLYANVYTTNSILKIDIRTGRVLGYLDLRELASEVYGTAEYPLDVLNGIAWNKEQKTMLVTGKRWPKYFELELAE
ncbi:MAG: glutaminyl-peptide cyclotransferase [Bacteroidales bacterium]